MYRAGWNAAQAVLALRIHSASPKTKSTATFATGLMCGVMLFGAGLTTRQFGTVEQSRQQDSVVEMNKTIPPVDVVVNPVTVAGDDATVSHPESVLSSFSALLIPWLNASDAGYVDVTPSAAKPLSIAARQQWSQMVLSDSAVLAVHRDSKETTVGDEQELPRLRTRPLRDVNMNDFL